MLLGTAGESPCADHESMATTSARWQSKTPYFLSLLRIVAAFVFMQHGAMKLFAFPAAAMPGGGTVPLASLMGAAGVLEVVGGALLLMGLFTRPVAFVLSGEMAVAYFTMHSRAGFWPTLNGGELAVLYCFIWLYISAAGPGPLSLDRTRSGIRR